MRKIKLLPLTLALLLTVSLLTATATAMVEPEGLNVTTSWKQPTPDTVEIPVGIVDALGGADPMEFLTAILSTLGGGDGEAPKEDSKPLTPEGNMTLVDDQGGSAAEKKERQFLTVTSRKGNYFYLIIDRANDGTENVHFLNQVDEADLLPLIDSGEDDTPAACSCTEKCYIGAVNTSCEICAANMAGCVGKEPPPEPDSGLSTEGEPTPEPDPQPEKKGGIGILPIVLAVLVAGGGAVYFLKFRKKAPAVKGGNGLDGYDYGDEDEPEDEADDDMEDGE